MGETVWFRMSVGREMNADPRWLLPLICRRGRVGKDDIGRIQIFDRETRFEVSAHVAERLAAGVRRPDSKDGQIRIEPVTARAHAPEHPPRHPGPHAPKKPFARSRFRHPD
jgi:ATP-dependent RNA helicase DeaD